MAFFAWFANLIAVIEHQEKLSSASSLYLGSAIGLIRIGNSHLISPPLLYSLPRIHIARPAGNNEFVVVAGNAGPTFADFSNTLLSSRFVPLQLGIDLFLQYHQFLQDVPDLARFTV